MKWLFQSSVIFTFGLSVAGVEEDQAQHGGDDADGHDQGDGSVGQCNERRPGRDQDAQSHDGNDEVDDGFVHDGIVREIGGGFRVLYWGT